jgi:hypothetical protein
MDFIKAAFLIPLMFIGVILICILISIGVEFLIEKYTRVICAGNDIVRTILFFVYIYISTVTVYYSFFK